MKILSGTEEQPDGKAKQPAKQPEEQDIYSFASSIFGGLARRFPSLYRDFDLKLRIARIKTTGLKYSSFILLVAFLATTMSLIFSAFLAAAVYGFKAEVIVSCIGFSLLIGALSGAIAYAYPEMLIGERRAKLDNSLAFAAIYLATIINSGLPPQMMFKMLAKFKHYKVVSEEAERISSDIHILGLDLPSALSRAMRRSPSPNWTELLAGIRNSVTAGGDVGKYLAEKSQGYIEDYKRKLAEFSNILSLFMNVYITVVIVGVVFFIIISSLMVSVGGMSVATVKAVQYMIVFLGLPLVTGAFILLIKSFSPWSD